MTIRTGKSVTLREGDPLKRTPSPVSVRYDRVMDGWTFVTLDLDTAPPDHSTISRTRRLIDVEGLYRGRPATCPQQKEILAR